MHLEEELAQSVLCESFILLLLLFNKNSDVIAQKHRVQLDKVSVKQSFFFLESPVWGAVKGETLFRQKVYKPEKCSLLKKLKVLPWRQREGPFL